MEQGSEAHSVSGHSLALTSGSLLTLAPGDTHDRRDPAGHGWVVGFSAEGIDPALADQPCNGATRLPLPGDPRWLAFVRHPHFHVRAGQVPAERRATWGRLMRDLARELTEQPVGYARAARAQLSLLLVDAARAAMPDDVQAFASPVDPVVSDVLDVIDRQYLEQLSLEDVARAVARSPSHLSRVIKELTGETVMHWIEQRRMMEARRLLLDTDLTVEAIAGRIGYRDPSYFRRRFRAAHAAPPQTWRQVNR